MTWTMTASLHFAARRSQRRVRARVRVRRMRNYQRRRYRGYRGYGVQVRVQWHAQRGQRQ
jgi:hypothetical protein